MSDHKYIYGVLTDKCVGYVLDDHSVTVHWISQWFILYKRTKAVRASNSVYQCFSFKNEQKRSGLEIQNISALPLKNEQKRSGHQVPLRPD